MQHFTPNSLSCAGENSQKTEEKVFSISAERVSEIHGLQRSKRKSDEENDCVAVSTTQNLSVQTDEVSGSV